MLSDAGVDDRRRLARAFRRVAASAAVVPLPGGGDTRGRLRWLHELARGDLRLARLVEAHVDALAILAEAGRGPVSEGTYAVWAAEDPRRHLQLVAAPGGWTLDGVKTFCGGAALVDRALVTADSDRGPVLVDIAVTGTGPLGLVPGMRLVDVWQTEAFASAAAVEVHFDGVNVSAGSVVGPPGFYLRRIGFWYGACGPAACWAGGAAGLVEVAERLLAGRDDPHRLADLGAMRTLRWRSLHLLDAVAARIDTAGLARRTPDAAAIDEARQQATMLRHELAQATTAIVEHFGAAAGPRALAFDRAVAERVADLRLAVRQHHAARELEQLGRDPLR